MLNLIYLQNYIAIFKRILFNDKDYQVLFVCGPNTHKQIQDGGRPPFLKIEKSPNLHNGLTDCPESWQVDTCWPRESNRPL